MVMAVRLLWMDRKGTGRRRMPSTRKLIARKSAGRYSVCCWQERKGSRSLRRLPFMQKVVALSRPTATEEKSNGCLHQAPSSHTQ
jgi:hypothetical protein